MKKYNKKWKLNYVDILKIFKEEPIVIKGAFDYSLKTIAKLMYSYNMISTTWNNSGENNCSNGSDAMLLALKAKEESIKFNISLGETKIMKNIEKYNEIDCKTLYEILNYLRINHN